MTTITRAALGALLCLVVAVACEPTPTPPATTTTTTTTTSPPVATNARPVQVDVSFTHGCAVYSDGTIRCWGNNRDGQLGNGTTAATTRQVSAVAVTGMTDAVEVAVGTYYSCARRSTGAIACWGGGSGGRLGNGSTTASTTPVAVSGITDAVSLAIAGSARPAACAVRATGGVRCWGSNERGQLGTDDITPSWTVFTATPVPVEGVTDAVQVSGDGSKFCARRTGGGIACWGDNQSGALGKPSVPSNLTPEVPTSERRSLLPVDVIGVAGARSVTVGGPHACALVGTSTRCWGGGGAFLGPLGTVPLVVGPTTAAAGMNFSSLDAGGATCGLQGTTVWCWGVDNPTRTGQIGNPGVPAPAPGALSGMPYAVEPMVATKATQPATDVANGSGVTCATQSDRWVRCWGDNPNGAALGARPPL